MIRASLDSNILIYATLEPQTEKGRRASEIIVRAAPRGILAAQVLLEFVAVIRRRTPNLTMQAIAQVEAWSDVFETAATTGVVVRDALPLIRDHQFQVWDAVICSSASNAGAGLFFSEDMQDGFAIGGMRIINPFTRTREELDQLLPV